MTLIRFLTAFLSQHRNSVEGRALVQIQTFLHSQNITVSNSVLKLALKKLAIAHTIRPTIKQIIEAADREEKARQ